MFKTLKSLRFSKLNFYSFHQNIFYSYLRTSFWIISFTAARSSKWKKYNRVLFKLDLGIGKIKQKLLQFRA